MQEEFQDGNSVTDEVLGAYIDGELDETARIEVEAYLARNPKAVEYIEQARRLRDNLHRLFDPQLAVPLPPHHEELAEEFERRTSYGPTWHIRPRLVAACAAALVLLGVAGVGWRYLSSDITGQRMFALFDQQLPAEANAKKEQAPATEQAAGELSGQQAVVKPAVATSEGDELEGGQQATGEQAPPPAASAPDFSSFGFNLVGTRVLAKNDDRSMQLIYESGEGARVELFYTSGPSSSKSSLTLMEEGPIAVLFWHNAGRSYSLIGEVDRNTLLEIGKVVNGEWTVPVPAAEQSSGGEKKQSKDDGSATPAAIEQPATAKPQQGSGTAPAGNETNAPSKVVPAETETEKQT